MQMNFVAICELKFTLCISITMFACGVLWELGMEVHLTRPKWCTAASDLWMSADRTAGKTNFSPANGVPALSTKLAQQSQLKPGWRPLYGDFEYARMSPGRLLQRNGHNSASHVSLFTVWRGSVSVSWENYTKARGIHLWSASSHLTV